MAYLLPYLLHIPRMLPWALVLFGLLVAFIALLSASGESAPWLMPALLTALGLVAGGVALLVARRKAASLEGQPAKAR